MKFNPSAHFCQERRPGGFTLMEMLIAVVACSIILAAIHGVFFGAVRLRNATDEALTRANVPQQALRVIERDLSNLVPPDRKLSGPLQFTGTLDGQTSPDFFTTTGTLSDQLPWSEVQKVNYILAESTNFWMGRDLIRAVSRNLLASSDNQPAYQWLMGGVSKIGFQFFDGTQWQQTWDSSTEEIPMPKGIRMQIELAATNRADRVQVLEVVVPIMTQSLTNSSQQATNSAR